MLLWLFGLGPFGLGVGWLWLCFVSLGVYILPMRVVFVNSVVCGLIWVVGRCCFLIVPAVCLTVFRRIVSVVCLVACVLLSMGCSLVVLC